MDKDLKEKMARQMRRAFEMCEARDEAAKKRKEAKALNPEPEDPDKAKFKKHKFTNKVKTETHRIVHGMTVTFADGRKANYKLGDIDTIVLSSKSRTQVMGQLLYNIFVNSIYRSFKKKVTDPEKDIVFNYTDVERARSIMGSGFYDRK